MKFTEKDIQYIEKEFGWSKDLLSIDPESGINMKAKLRVGGRIAPIGNKWMLSPDAMAEHWDHISKYKYDAEEFTPEEIEQYNFSDVLLGCPAFKNDNKYNVDLENCTICWKPYTLDNGVSFLVGMMGGDWESPVLYFIYWDGKTYRAYFPLKGNAVNPINKRAFGNGADYMNDTDDTDDNNVDYKFFDMFPEYKKYYDEKHGFRFVVNINACVEDFESRLIAKN